MGGRGTKSRLVTRVQMPQQQQTQQPQQQAQQQVQNQSTPSGYTLADLRGMDDKTLHDFLINVQNTDLPPFLNANRHTQRMVYALGMNDKPEIVSDKEFQKLVKSGKTVMYRTVNDTQTLTADDICDMFTDGDLTYLGDGVHGDGLYFSDNLRGSKMYGHTNPKTIGAVFNGKAKPISETNLRSLYDQFIKTHPQARKAFGFARNHSTHDSFSQFALSQGYNIITSRQSSNETYYTILDRSVLTMTKKRY